MKTKLMILVLAGLLICSSTAFGQFNYGGRDYGIQVDLGLGFTKGIGGDLVDGLKKALGAEIDFSGGATLRFGATGSLKLMRGFYLRPTVQVSFYGQEIDISKFRDNNNNQLDKIDWSHTDINFGVLPTYYLRFANLPIHPFGGLGIKFNLNSIGDPEIYWKNGTKQKLVDGESKFTFGIAPFVGAEYAISDKMAIPLRIQFDIRFSGEIASVFYIGSGFTTYF